MIGVAGRRLLSSRTAATRLPPLLRPACGCGVARRGHSRTDLDAPQVETPPSTEKVSEPVSEGTFTSYWRPPTASHAKQFLKLDALTEVDVPQCQANWANAIKTISSTYLRGGDYVEAAANAAGELYGYGKSKVLFKPTRATNNPFRPTAEDAMSYFVGAEAMRNERFKGEDAGFAINGGKGWKEVVFTNHQIELLGECAIAMGSYDFTCATTGDVATVEYTFGYRRNDDGAARIFLHHSSVPYG